MLDTTLATTFVPGSNLKGDVAGANWSFLLPSLELEQTLCLGAPPPATLATLAGFSEIVVVICADSRQVQHISQLTQQRGLDNVRPFAVNGGTALPLPGGQVDLALIIGGKGVWRLSRDRALLADLQRLLKPGGLIYFEFGGLLGRLLGDRVMAGLGEGFGAPQRFWLTPTAGEMHTAVPVWDHKTISYFLHEGLYGRSVNLRTSLKQIGRFLKRYHRGSSRLTAGSKLLPGPAMTNQSARYLRPMVRKGGTNARHWLESVEGSLSRYLLENRLVKRYGALVGRAADGLAAQPPRYLRSIARDAGVDITNHRWGLVVPGDYSSRKVLFFLFDPAMSSPGRPGMPSRLGAGMAAWHHRASELLDTPPQYIVKLIRDPIFNARLKNEYRALKLLESKGIGDRETLPRVVFFGQHRDLAILGETAIDGTPFRQRTEATATCPYARAAVDWLIDLSAATADSSAATPEQVAAALQKLFRRFVEIYRLTPEHQTFLSEQMATIACSQQAFPLVFQHGDPGTWNVMTTKSGRVAFLDWEAAEPQGMPLWDLFYFMRSYIVWAARVRGIRDRLEGFRRGFLAESPLSQMVIEVTGRYCEQAGLPGYLVEPLFYTCWMHRALKEANRLRPAKLEEGHYVNLLRLCIHQHDAPTLRRLFS